MSYSVEWSRTALRQLAATWLAAPDRGAVTSASHRLERALASGPYAVGLPRGSSVNRTAIDLPLGIEYEIIEDNKKVRVIGAWSLL